MDGSIVDTMTSVLYESLVPAGRVRDALLACLDLVPPDDGDARVLRYILDREPGDAGLDEFQMELAQIRDRMVSRLPLGSCPIPRIPR